MALTITKESKNTLALSNEDKDTSMTWDELDPLIWDDDTGVWSHPRRPFDKDSKNILTITNDSKV